jgi:hypothetical protein
LDWLQKGVAGYLDVEGPPNPRVFQSISHKSSRESAGGRAGTEEMGSLKIQFDLGITHQHPETTRASFP